MTGRFAERAAPLVFVVFWASGFVVARWVRPYAEPESFVALRFSLSASLFAAVTLVGGAAWPSTWRGWRDSLIAGVLMQGLYVGGAFWAVKHGLPTAVTALVVGLQPLLTAALAEPLLRERVSQRRWLGILLGFLGAVLVLVPNLAGAGAVPPAAIVVCFGAMIAITLGTIWQKKTGQSLDLRPALALQFIGGVIVTLPLALATEAHPFLWHRDLWFGLAWAVFVLSVVANLLLLWLIKSGAVARVTSLFYLVPPVTALMAFALFGEALAPIQFAGMAVAAGGVAIASRG